MVQYAARDKPAHTCKASAAVGRSSGSGCRHAHSSCCNSPGRLSGSVVVGVPSGMHFWTPKKARALCGLMWLRGGLPVAMCRAMQANAHRSDAVLQRLELGVEGCGR